MNIYNSIDEIIGKTPLMELKNIEKELNLEAKIFGKLEGMNPAGSIKDRAALNMILDAEKKGLIEKGGTIIEPTSGNTGIGLAALAASRGYKAIFVLPESMSVERRNLLKAYGAEVVLTAKELGMKGCMDKAEELKKELPNSFIPGQFDNKANAEAHYKTTGPEIWEETDGKIDVLVAGIGTGGTITGIGTYLKEKNQDVEIIAVEPAGSPLLTEGKTGPHNLQGIGANFVPSILNREVLDKIITITEDEAYEMGRLTARKEGYLVGISSGAALSAAVKLAKEQAYFGKNIVVVLPDSGERYLSTVLFQE